MEDRIAEYKNELNQVKDQTIVSENSKKSMINNINHYLKESMVKEKSELLDAGISKKTTEVKLAEKKLKVIQEDNEELFHAFKIYDDTIKSNEKSLLKVSRDTKKNMDELSQNKKYLNVSVK